MALKIKQIAKQRGFTMVQVAERLGVNPVSLSSAINGNPTVATLEKIANVLGVDVADFFDKEDKPTINGYVEIGGEIMKISSAVDLEKALEKAKKIGVIRPVECVKN